MTFTLSLFVSGSGSCLCWNFLKTVSITEIDRTTCFNLNIMDALQGFEKFANQQIAN